MRIDVLTLFPDMFREVLATSMPGRATDSGAVEYQLHDLRDWTKDKHRSVDDRPFGGGPGMVMMCEPLWDAVHAVEAMETSPARRVLLTPQGEPLTQARVEELATEPRLLLIAGHYEGIDERVIDELDPLEISIGDYVLSGGELPALVVLEAVGRLVPGVVGDAILATSPDQDRIYFTGHGSEGQGNGETIHSACLPSMITSSIPPCYTTPAYV